MAAVFDLEFVEMEAFREFVQGRELGSGMLNQGIPGRSCCASVMRPPVYGNFNFVPAVSNYAFFLLRKSPITSLK